MNLVSIIALCVSGVMLIFSVLTFGRNAQKDKKSEDAADDAKIDGIKESLLKANMKLDQVCATTNETRADIKAINRDIKDMDKRVTIVERDLKTAFSRIDELRGNSPTNR